MSILFTRILQVKKKKMRENISSPPKGSSFCYRSRQYERRYVWAHFGEQFWRQRDTDW
jgi:hypothetical protein